MVTDQCTTCGSFVSKNWIQICIFQPVTGQRLILPREVPKFGYLFRLSTDTVRLPNNSSGKYHHFKRAGLSVQLMPSYGIRLNSIAKFLDGIFEFLPYMEFPFIKELQLFEYSYQRILGNCMLLIWPMMSTVTFRLKPWWIQFPVMRPPISWNEFPTIFLSEWIIVEIKHKTQPSQTF